MKKGMTIILFCIFLLSLEAFAFQAEAAKGEEQAKTHVNKLASKLKLTASQQSKIQAILTEEHQQHMSLDKESLSREDKMARAHAMHAVTHAKIRAVLNASQKRQFDSIVHGKGNGPATANHVKQLSARLNLSAEQQSKLKGLMEEQHQKHMDLSRDTSLSRTDKMSKAHGLHQETENKIREMLNDDQKKKFDQMVHAEGTQAKHHQ